MGASKTNGLMGDDGKFRTCTNSFQKIGKGTLDYQFTAKNPCMAWGGDSGGPAFVNYDGRTHLVGVNSGGKCCKFGSID